MTWIGRSVLDTLRAREMTVCGCYRTRRLPLRRHRNPGAVAAAHQHAILGLALTASQMPMAVSATVNASAATLASMR